MSSRNRRRVLQVLGPSAGGIARHVALVTKGLDGREGIAIDIAAPEELPVEMPKPVMPLLIPNGTRGHRAARRRIREIVDQGDHHVVNAHGLRAGIDSGLAMRGSDRSVFLTVHNLVLPDISGAPKAFFLRRAEPLAVRLTTRTFAASEQIAQHLRAVAPRLTHKIETLHAPVGVPPSVSRSSSEVREELGMDASQKLVVTAARLAPQKALHVMLDALAELPPDVVLAVVGEGPLEAQLREQGANLGIEDRVKWMGFRSDVGDFIAAADVVALSSVWEAVALVAQEAVLLGVPVVSTDVGGMGELITDKRSGRLVPKGDHKALAAAMSEVLESEHLRSTYATNALHDLRQRFSREKMLERLSEAYRE